MKIARRLIDDLKTERPNVTPPLPAYLRLVPILFYGAVLGGIVLSGLFLVVLRNATATEQQWKAEAAETTRQLAEVQAARGMLESQARRAGDIVAWVEGARSLQPLLVGIIRGMEPTSSIISLEIARDPSNSRQIKLDLKLNAQSSRQIDSTLQEIASHDYRTYNPNQTQSRGEVDYQATLLYQPARSLPVPADGPSVAPKTSSAPAAGPSATPKTPPVPAAAPSVAPKASPAP